MLPRLIVSLLVAFVTACGATPQANDAGQAQDAYQAPDDSGNDQTPDTAVVTPDVAPVPDTRCFVVYVHGLNDTNLDPSVSTPAQRRAYWQATPGSNVFDFVYASSRHESCLTLVTGYDSRAAFFEDAAAGSVARQIAMFVQDNNVPDNRLILIGHSMGGLVIREILNYADMNPTFGFVSQKTNYAITVATPHTGSPGADALYGIGDTACSNVIAALLEFTGMVTTSMGTESLTRPFMEEESANGGLMRDRFRTRRIYTVSTTGWNLGIVGNTEDVHLQEAWNCLGYGDCLGCTLRPGDGVVTLYSGEGRYERTGSSNGYSWTINDVIEGPWTMWLMTNLNHHHAAHSDVQVNIMDWVRNTSSSGGSIGDYIATYGLNLQ